MVGGINLIREVLAKSSQIQGNFLNLTYQQHAKPWEMVDVYR